MNAPVCRCGDRLSGPAIELFLTQVMGRALIMLGSRALLALAVAVGINGLAPVGILTARGTDHSDADHRIDTWGVADGMPEDSATAMAQSADGYLWFGTFDGLVRFNGVEFKVFNPRNTPELPGAGIVNLHLDRSGLLWVSTYRGLVVGEAGAAPEFRPVEGWPDSYVRTFTERPNGDLLITSFDGRLFEFSNGRLTELPSPPGARGQGYFGGVDADGHWWAVQSGFIGRLEHGSWAAKIPPPGVKGDAVGCTAARDGALWLLLGGELLKLQRGVEVARVSLPESPGGVWSLSEDSQGTLWISSHNEGLRRVTTAGRVTRINATNGGSDQVRFVFEDRERSLWIGTSGDGLLRLTPRRFRHFGLVEGRKGLAVRSVTPDFAGGVWVATYGRGLFRVSDAGATPAPLLDPTDGSSYLQSVMADRSGRLWAGTFSKSLRVVEDSRVRHVPGELIGGVNPIALFEDSQGRTWIGGGGGSIAVCDNQGFRRFELMGDSRRLAVTCFAEDAAGDLWAANDGSVFRWDGDQSVVEVTENGRSIGGIACLKADPDGSMWLGSFDRGLLRWKDGRLSGVGAQDGFPVGPLLAIVEDDLGYFWMTSARHLVRARRGDLLAAADGGHGLIAWQRFDDSDGLPEAEFSRGRQPTIARDERGRLWFATSKGVTMVHPAKLRLNDLPPPVAVEAISFYRPVSVATGHATSRYGTGELPSRVSPPFAVPVPLPRGSRRVEIHYAALSLVAPGKVRYQIKLEGRDSRWQDAGSRRTAYYHELPPREYVFRVRAANNDGVWNETGASLAFLVQPFYWQTGWFQGLAWAASMGGVGGGVWGIMRAKVRRQAERLAHERDLRQAREKLSHLTRVAILGELSGSLAHELNQPLNAILNNAQAALRFLKSGNVNLDELREILEDIAADDQRAGEVIRRLRLLLKRGEVQLQALNLNDLVLETLKLVHSDLVTRNVTVLTELDPRLPPVQGDRVQLQQVFLNLILNGCDAMADQDPQRRRLEVRTGPADGGGVQVSVVDCGHGVPPDRLADIFEPFVTTKQQGLGLGLSISRSLIEAHGGRIQVRNNAEAGSTFSFVLPKARASGHHGT
ncbi:MAG: hypothetical protein KF791_04390 [Verrucomicrobiae bacterium]|nr:hypothetical protein [Verrucomicrobiae bacterium]